MCSVKNTFAEEVDLVLPGFEKSVPSGTVKQLSLIDIDSGTWFKSFVDELNDAIGKRFLPVYRMADGEFIFCVGRKPDLPPVGASSTEKFAKFMRGSAAQLFRKFHNSETTCWGENYSGISVEELMDHYVACLREVAEKGKLAIHFTRSDGRFSEQYIEPMCRFFHENRIPVDEKNYTAFYFVYALLCGPAINEFVKDRTIMIVTSTTKEKRAGIESNLISRGAKKVLFQEISPNRSMLDKVDLSGLREQIDIAFVAAGIGSANILSQLEPLNTVCLDIGACMEILADNSRRGRVFTVAD